MYRYSNLSPWLLRIELNNHRCIEKDLKMEHIEEKIESFFKDDIQLWRSDNNDYGHKILRIRIKNSEAEDGDDDDMEETMSDDQVNP